MSATQGAGATLVGYAVAGMLSFGLTETGVRALKGLTGPASAFVFNTPLLVLASAFAVTACAVAVCPFEAVRVRAVASGGRESSREALAALLDEGGLSRLFAGLGPILLKEVPFVIAKFVAFDQAPADACSAASPLALASGPHCACPRA